MQTKHSLLNRESLSMFICSFLKGLFAQSKFEKHTNQIRLKYLYAVNAVFRVRVFCFGRLLVILTEDYVHRSRLTLNFCYPSESDYVSLFRIRTRLDAYRRTSRCRGSCNRSRTNKLNLAGKFLTLTRRFFKAYRFYTGIKLDFILSQPNQDGRTSTQLLFCRRVEKNSETNLTFRLFAMK